MSGYMGHLPPEDRLPWLLGDEKQTQFTTELGYWPHGVQPEGWPFYAPAFKRFFPAGWFEPYPGSEAESLSAAMEELVVPEPLPGEVALRDDLLGHLGERGGKRAHLGLQLAHGVFERLITVAKVGVLIGRAGLDALERGLDVAGGVVQRHETSSAVRSPGAGTPGRSPRTVEAAIDSPQSFAAGRAVGEGPRGLSAPRGRLSPHGRDAM